MIKWFFNLENRKKKNIYVESVKCIYFCYKVGELFIVGKMVES